MESNESGKGEASSGQEEACKIGFQEKVWNTGKQRVSSAVMNWQVANGYGSEMRSRYAVGFRYQMKQGPGKLG